MPYPARWLLLMPAAFARADVVTDWNEIAIQTPPPSVVGPPQMRVLAYVHAAIFDAVNAVERRYAPFLVEMPAAPDTSAAAAAAGAAHGLLTRLYPLQRPALDMALERSLAGIGDVPGRQRGLELGQAVAERVHAISRDDGAATSVRYQPEPQPWSWRPTSPGVPAALPQWGRVRPLTLKDLAGFQLPGPLPTSGAAYAGEIEEVRRLGSDRSVERTSEQTATAIFWTVSMPVPFNQLARTVAARRNHGLVENARLFALLNAVGSDSQIVAWAAKYQYSLLRPVTAIREAPLLGNAAIRQDPAWRPLIVTPAHPDYISGHCAGTGAYVRMLQLFLGSDEADVTVVHPPVFGVARHWQTLSGIEREVEDARIWGGIHTRTANTHATEVGRRVAEHAFATMLLPRP